MTYNIQEYTGSTGIGNFSDIPVGRLRLVTTQSGYNGNTIYLDITQDEGMYNQTIYMTNATSPFVNDLVLIVADEIGNIVEGAIIKIYIQDEDDGTFDVIGEKITNLNGIAQHPFVINRFFYKFIVFTPNLEKCYETFPGNEFQIQSTDEQITFTCSAISTYQEIRDASRDYLVTIGFIETSNRTGTFSMTAETISGEAKNFCMQVRENKTHQTYYLIMMLMLLVGHTMLNLQH